MGLLTKLTVVAFIGANAKIIFRLSTSVAIIFIINLIYTKYESLLLITNPEKLYIPLYIYTLITVTLIIWTLVSFKSLTSFKESEKKLEVTESFKNKPNEYQKINDVKEYPKLRTKKEQIINTK
tara:strand:+ start:444 stop:815 length:372 start_codon:yes stop_codon:yes gene_type:complete